MTEVLKLYPESDHPFLIRQYNIAIATGLSKSAAKQFAAAMVNDKSIDLSHLRVL